MNELLTVHGDDAVPVIDLKAMQMKKRAERAA
jgi:hypothetical protein